MEEKIFGFVYNMAFRDATLRKAFQKKDGEEEKDFQDRKNYIKSNAKEIVKEYINNIFKGERPDPIITIIKLCKEFEDKSFTFGNAQKLVNMTAKYMYITTYNDSSKRSLFEKCDCPMDHIMINVVSKDARELLHKEKVSYKQCSWSKLDIINGESPKEYNDFQEDVLNLRSNEYVIDYEYKNYE